ncbi:carbamoyltransferase HypF [Rhodocyclus tenuis]|uniref:Carbamoyltransferase HypF n=1 Tax=Rhodocyclus tenuis TaxID=1066 RepID=A0A840GCF4_RHOTE|nr:carbamoyltransferase HypF [Rhodocyclus tenuis]MBB4248540.1 hydrogenase maturation protein HypF [Rhodocyclus tenuis]
MSERAVGKASALRLRVRGQVQGVGFRPYVFRLAGELGLAGWVRNDGEGVDIAIDGAGPAIARFIERLPAEAPPLARIAAVEVLAQADEGGYRDFRIVASGGGALRTEVAPDAGICADCLEELFASGNRRYRYAFINCTQCGPRYSILRGLPYDRPQTSMAAFAQCPECLGEYTAPANRRFHAEPNACAHCGPQLALHDSDGRLLAGVDVVADALARLLRGEIVAIKGAGGFHLACDARNAAAVARLRLRKQREEKPFAVMFAGTASLAGFAAADAAAHRLLESPERPVVLLRKSADCDAALPGVAPGLAWLGAMLPSTPLHYLLFHEAAGRPAGSDWLATAQPLVLLMTSANPGGEPLVTGNDEALTRLRGIADVFVLHDRDIVARCDDSVLRLIAESPSPVPSAIPLPAPVPTPVPAEMSVLASAQVPSPAPGAAPSSATAGDPPFQFIRRARGYTPQAIALAGGGTAVLACGAYLKNSLCLLRGEQAFMSPHIGDLDNAASCVALDAAAMHLLDLLRIEPAVVAHDLHPDFYSSRFAAGFAAQRGLPCCAVQHHHAHIAAVMAEHRLSGEVLGLALDGVGLGSEGDEAGGQWGGELLRVSARNFARLGHLRPLPLPGGDRAAREPWRMAAAALHALGRGDEIAGRFDRPAAALLGQLLDDGRHAPLSSSCGRLFDAAAGLAGVSSVASFEGQAAMLYEGLAEAHGAVPVLADGYRIGSDGVLDLLPLLAQLADEPRPGFAAALFHVTLAAALADWIEFAAAQSGLRRVALGGGCCLNRFLLSRLRAQLEQRGFAVFEAQQVPPNDGGLSLGQAWVARHRLLAGEI